jgi:uncharacterized protein
MRINYQRLVHYIFHHHIAIIVIATLVSVIAGIFASRLASNIKTDFADLLPEDYISVRELQRIKARVGGIGPLMVVITGDDLERCIDFMHVLADSLETNQLVSSVTRYNYRDFVSRNRLLYMELDDLQEIHQRLQTYVDEEKLRQSPLYFALDDDEPNVLDLSDIEARYQDLRRASGVAGASKYGRKYYLTPEGNGVILRLYPSGVITDLVFSTQLIESLDRTVAAIDPTSFGPSIEYEYKGSFTNSAGQMKIIMDDLKSTATLSLLGVLLLISIYFRQVLASVFVALPLLMGLSWTFGLTYVVIGSLNMITVGLFAILFGLGIDFGIHTFARYREARRRGLGVEDSLTETVVHTGSALTTTAVTTSVAFYSLMITDFKGFSEFGFIVGTGILFSLLAMLVVCPAFIVLAERVRLTRLREKSVPDHLLRRGRFPLPRLALLLGLVATVYSLTHIGQIEFEYDFSKLKPRLVPENGNQGSLPESLKEDRSPAIILTESVEEAAAVVATVMARKEALGDSSTVMSVYSVSSALPSQQDEKLLAIASIKQLLDRSQGLLGKAESARIDSVRLYLDVSRVGMADLPSDLTNKFRGKDGEILNFVMINSSVALKDGRNAIRFADEISHITTASGRDYYASSSHVIIAEMLRVMLDDSVLAVVLTLAVVTVVLFIDLRSIADTLIVLSPLLTALIWITGLMYLLDIRLNLYNMIAFPTVIGMGIDNGVHLFHRYRENGRGSLRLVLRTTGITLLATSLTTMVGFAGLVPAQHPALTSIGTLSLIGLGCCFVTSITLLPALLQVREKRAD